MIIIQLESEQLDSIIQNAVKKALNDNVPNLPTYDNNLWFDLDGFRQYHPDNPSKATVYGWVSEKKIPYYKDKGNKKLRFLKSDIDEWLSEGRQRTVKEINSEAHLALKKKSPI